MGVAARHRRSRRAERQQPGHGRLVIDGPDGVPSAGRDRARVQSVSAGRAGAQGQADSIWRVRAGRAANGDLRGCDRDRRVGRGLDLQPAGQAGRNTAAWRCGPD